MRFLPADSVCTDSWSLDFYDARNPFIAVGDLVPGVGDVLARAKGNGARDGTPFFVNPSGRADALVNAFWRDPFTRGRPIGTVRRYAMSLKVWLDFLHAIGVPWDRASRSELAAFKEWRLSAEENEKHVVSNSFCVDQAAIRRFHHWAAEQRGIENPVRVRSIATSYFGVEQTVLESTPSGVRRADVKWLTPQAFRLWRNVDLRGFAMDVCRGRVGVDAPRIATWPSPRDCSAPACGWVNGRARQATSSRWRRWP